MAWGETPRRDAVSRSIVSDMLQAGGLLVARDVARARAASASASSICGAHSASSSAFGVLERVLVLRAAHAAVDLQVLHGLQVERDRRRPAASFGGRRAMISAALALRSSRGLSVMESRPLLVVGVRPVGADERGDARDVGILRARRRRRRAAGPSSA